MRHRRTEFIVAVTNALPGVVSGAPEESAGGEAEAEGGRAGQTLGHDLHDPQPQQREDEVRRQPLTLSRMPSGLPTPSFLLSMSLAMEF